MDKSKHNKDSDLDYISDEEISYISKKDYDSVKIQEKVMTYLKLDDLEKKIKKEKSESLKVIKEQKEKLINPLIKYLDEIDEDFYESEGFGKLSKYDSKRKKGINVILIGNSIYDTIKKKKILKRDSDIQELVDDILLYIDTKREITVSKKLKRIIPRKKIKK